MRMPVLFLGHGSPMNAITENPFRIAWRECGAGLPRPRAVLCVSAHWLTRGTQVTLAERPRTIHDFGGFPPELYRQEYPAPGSPECARRTMELMPEVTGDTSWGLDHGAWCVLSALYPAADVPVYQMSLDTTRPAQDHLALGQELRALREEGVLIVASGNVVHNLRQLRPDGVTPDWALEFDEWVRQRLERGDGEALAGYRASGAAARMAVPTEDHYLPLLYALGARDEDEPGHLVAEGFDWGSISMRSVMWGGEQ
jgi:4,5-DOPA dioxygenase extradiol